MPRPDVQDDDSDSKAFDFAPSQPLARSGAEPESASTRPRVFLSHPFHDLFGGRRGRLAALVAGSLFVLAASLVPAFAMGLLVDTAFAHHSKVELAELIGVLVAVHVAEMLVARRCESATLDLRRERVRVHTADFVERLDAAPLAALERHSPAAVLTQLRAIPTVIAFHVNWFVLVLSRPLFFAAALAWLALQSAVLAMAILAMTAVYVRLTWLAGQRMRDQFARESAAALALRQALHEFAQGLPTLRFGGLIARFHRSLEARRGTGPESDEDAAEPWIVRFTRSYASGSFFVVLALGAWLVLDGELSLGRLIIANVVFRRVLAEARGLVSRVRRYHRSRAAADDVSRFLDTLVAGPGARGAGSRGEVPAFERIVLERANWLWPSTNEAVLHEVDLEIRRGEFVAIVGPSGSGKTTLLKAIVGLYPPASGRIEHVGGVAGDNVRYAYLSPADTLFDRSVHANISLQRKSSREHVVAAARTSTADEFIARLPQGYDTRLRNGGANFSQGQKARLALARCLASDAPLLLMDEPTSALDPDSERRVVEQLQALRGARTLVIVTHRPAPALAADRVIVVENGRVVEQGRPAHLATVPGGAFWRWCRDAEFAPAQRTGRRPDPSPKPISVPSIPA